MLDVARSADVDLVLGTRFGEATAEAVPLDQAGGAARPRCC